MGISSYYLELKEKGKGSAQQRIGIYPGVLRKKNPAFQDVPVVYFTQLMALAFGLGEETHAFGENKPDPRPLLRSKGLIQE